MAQDVNTEKLCSALLHDILRLQKTLEPRAVFHLDHNIVKLRVHVKSAEILIHSLPCAQELQENLDIAVKGIVKIKQTFQTKKQKPGLNMGGRR